MKLQSVSKFLAEASWRVWAKQLAAVVRTDLTKNFFTRRGTWIYMLAFAPVVIIGAHSIESWGGRRCNLQEDTKILAYIFQIFYLRMGIFFGSLGIFTWLFRGEIVEKSLHYYFLAPMRRELLVLGKFIAGAITAIFFFGLGVLASFTLMYVHFGPAGRAFVFDGPGLGHLAAYLGVTVLACLGYGSIFLALSLLLKNPMITAAIVLIWETFHAVLPSVLQKFSVTFYLKYLCPVSIPPDGVMALFTVVSDPVSPWIAVPGLLTLCLAVLALACLKVRRLEISYVAE
jgi:ABC-type transport system involved in multi-copper enzyme maturation permease subunit